MRQSKEEKTHHQKILWIYKLHAQIHYSHPTRCPGFVVTYGCGHAIFLFWLHLVSHRLSYACSVNRALADHELVIVPDQGRHYFGHPRISPFLYLHYRNTGDFRQGTISPTPLSAPHSTLVSPAFAHAAVCMRCRRWRGCTRRCNRRSRSPDVCLGPERPHGWAFGSRRPPCLPLSQPPLHGPVGRASSDSGSQRKAAPG